MATLGESAEAHEPHTKVQNIADLDFVQLDAPVTNVTGTNKEGEDFEYSVIEVDGQKFRVPSSVLEQIKTLKAAKPELSKVKVVKSGTGMSTVYQTIPLE